MGTTDRPFATMRATRTITETVVSHRAEPRGPSRQVGPHLVDLRAFLKACDGLPDDVRVSVEPGLTNADGKHDVILKVVHQVISVVGDDRGPDAVEAVRTPDGLGLRPRPVRDQPQA